MPRRTTGTDEDPVKQYFIAKRSKDFIAWAIVTCPREECGETFLVKIKEWLTPLKAAVHKDVIVYGKPCPYCFKTAYPPRRKDIRR